MIRNWTFFLKSPPPAGPVLLVGPEEVLVGKLTSSRGPEWRVERRFASRQEELPELIKLGREGDLFQRGKRAVVVEVARDFALKKKKDADSLLQLLPALKNYVFLYGRTLNSRSRFVEWMLAQGVPAYYVYPLKEEERIRYLEDLLKKVGKRVSYEVLDTLSRKGPQDLTLLEGEVRKLLLYIGDRGEITRGDLTAVSSLERGEEVETLLALLFHPRALGILRELRRQGADPNYLWAALSRHLLSLFWASLSKRAGVGEEKRGGWYAPAAVKELIQSQASKISGKEERVADLLREGEGEFKGGGRERFALLEGLIRSLNR